MKILKWEIQRLPISEKQIPDKWVTGTKHKIFGMEFIVWLLQEQKVGEKV